MRWITREGGTFCIMAGAGLESLPAFVLASSKSVLASGQIATIPMFIGAVLQNFAPGALRWLGSVRLWSVGMAFFQGLCLLALAFGSTFGQVPLWATFTLVSLYVLGAFILSGFTLNGLSITWALPEYNTLFLSFLAMIQTIIVASAGLLLTALVSLFLFAKQKIKS